MLNGAARAAAIGFIRKRFRDEGDPVDWCVPNDVAAAEDLRHGFIEQQQHPWAGPEPAAGDMGFTDG